MENPLFDKKNLEQAFRHIYPFSPEAWRVLAYLIEAANRYHTKRAVDVNQAEMAKTAEVAMRRITPLLAQLEQAGYIEYAGKRLRGTSIWKINL